MRRSASRGPITHAVKFYERGSRPLEIVTSRQWYIRNGGRDSELRAALVKRGGEVTWHPAHMQHRYDNWVEGLNGDWLVSRQRFFGVPIPVWYRLDDAGEPDYDEPLVPDESQLPIDPSTDVPARVHAPTSAAQPGGFIGDPDVFDTWATSSLTPQIAGRWEDDPELFARVFPMDMRPQAHDIIRTWLFATVVRSHYESGGAPWRHAHDVRLDPRPRPQEDVEVEGQRRHADGLVRPVRHRRRPLLVGVGATRASTPRSARIR